ncbi:MAG: glycosyltransferase family 4 protein [Planctomycetes bacterium]|nr:glycosyltransferase family 4 protein [Planctomycetota bacterium]MBM4057212.1 glycosyltransferase family 4 protein [Planctomycetota bacterium]
MPSLAPDPLTSRPLTVWLVDPFDDIPGEGTPPLRYWSLARVLAARGHDVTWWTATWSHRRKSVRTAPLGIHEDEGFAVRLVATRPYAQDVSLVRIASYRDFSQTFERLANEGVSSGQIDRPDIILASLPPLDGSEAALRLARKLDATFILDATARWPEMVARLVPGPRFLRPLIAPLLLGDVEGRRHAIVAAADALAATADAHAAAAFRDAPGGTPRHVCCVGTFVAEFPAPPPALAHVPFPGEQSCARPDARPLACVASVSPEVGLGIDILPAVARQLSAKGVAATIHVIGSGPLEDSLRRAAAVTGGSCRLEVHGSPGRRDYVGLLGRCDVGIVLTRPDAMAVMPAEVCDYAASGLAIVNASPGELAAMLEQHDAGVAYAPGDAVALAKTITALAVDRGGLAAMRQAARRLAERHLDREKTYAAFADWIETIHGGG